MHRPLNTFYHLLTTASILVAVSGCSWVDSTGAQSANVTSAATGGQTLRNAQPVTILEESSLTASLEGEGSTLHNWLWLLEDTNVNNRCAGLNGFDTRLAATSLVSACTNADACNVAIDESSGNGDTRFTLRIPQLSAPVALSYRLTATRDDGAVVSRQQLICGLSMNEAPVADNDLYISLRNELRIVNPTDADSLLSNDSDDKDVRNQPLSVLTTPVTAPRYAAQFSLDSEGGFIYAHSENLPRSDAGYVEDSFVYAVTDGLHTVNATAVIRIVDGNTGPERLRRIPDVNIDAPAPQASPSPVIIDLSLYFADPDNDTLSYSIAEGTLPEDSELVSLQNELLILKPSESDAGRWQIEVVASDGLASRSDIFLLTVRSGIGTIDSRENTAPDVTDISNRIVQNSFRYDVSRFFKDEDDDPLTFTANGLPDGVSISSSGVISGRSDDNNRSTFFVTVTADDSRGGTVSDGFLLVIN